MWIHVTNLNHLIPQPWKKPLCTCKEGSIHGSHSTRVQLRNLKSATNFYWELPDLNIVIGCGYTMMKKKSMNYLFRAYWGYSYFLKPKTDYKCYPSCKYKVLWKGRRVIPSYKFVRKCVFLLGEQQNIVIVPSGSSIFLTGSMQIFPPV